MAELLVKTLVRLFMTITDRLNTSTGSLAIALAIGGNCLFCRYLLFHAGERQQGGMGQVRLRA
ncbi:hypothetical protein CK627_12675 [Aeromonas dhakensis]|nr:hypothetical protein CK627_12675 [Aeromonas dhakensis]